MSESEERSFLSAEQEALFAQKRDALRSRMEANALQVLNIIAYGGGVLSLYTDGAWNLGYHPDGGIHYGTEVTGSSILEDYADFSDPFLQQLYQEKSAAIRHAFSQQEEAEQDRLFSEALNHYTEQRNAYLAANAERLFLAMMALFESLPGQK